MAKKKHRPRVELFTAPHDTSEKFHYKVVKSYDEGRYLERSNAYVQRRPSTGGNDTSVPPSPLQLFFQKFLGIRGYL